MLKQLQTWSLLFALLGASQLLTGCFDADEDESQIPWAQPASWEGGMPGMPGMGMTRDQRH